MRRIPPSGGSTRFLTRSLAVAASALALTAAACGSSAPGSSRSGGGASTGTATVDPNAPEASPPGDIPDNQAFVTYRPPAAAFSVKVPEGWARTTHSGVTSFTDKLNRVQLQQQHATAALTPARARATVVPQLQREVRGFRLGSVTSVARTAGRAVRITYLARSSADPVTGKSRTDAVERYIFFHAGTAVVLTLSGPKGADNVDPWRIVTDSLRFTA
jgi:hypothetical protein